MPTSPRVRTGLDVLADDGFSRLRGKRVGLVTHPAAVDRRLRHSADLIAQADGVRLVALFGPEHGLLGEAQDLIGVSDGGNPLAGVRVHSLYGDSVASLKPTPEQLRDLDLLVVDLQDVGSRYYTFPATMLFCMETASAVGLPVLVLDRPNPIGGLAVEGPTLVPGFESFVGIHPLQTRHGLTIGELARLYRAERGLTCELEVVACDGWRRDMFFEATGLPWVLPSPNMPTVDTAVVYPGQCLIEGTNLSEGRGTTRPFELCGAPGIDPRRLCERLSGEDLPGVVFRPAWFQPTFQKHAGKRCGGLQLHVLNRTTFRPVRTGLAVLAALRDAAGDQFAWRREAYEFVSNPIAIDLLFGSNRERKALDKGQGWREIGAAWEPEEAEFRRRRAEHLIYGPWEPKPGTETVLPGDRFTDRARKAMQLANQEAHRANGQVVGTEHVLLGLLKEGSGVAAIVLKSRGLDLNDLRRRVDETMPSGPPTVLVKGRLPQTPLVKKLIEHAIEEARKLGSPHNYVGTEHLLLGLLREPDGIAVQVLTRMGHDPGDIRNEVLPLAGGG